MAIAWTKYWQGSDDGTVLKAVDLKNIQDDLSVVQTVGDPLVISGQTQGDVLYYNGSAWVRLAAGTAGEVLTSQGAGANPTFTVPTAGDLVVASQATGDILYYDGANWVVIPPGTSGQVLTSNGAGAAPTYQDITGASGREEFLVDGTFTSGAGITKVYLTMIGGGGTGGTGSGSGGGGGAGGLLIDFPYTVTPSTGYAVVVGAAALDSTFDGTATAPGGNSGGDGVAGLSPSPDATTSATGVACIKQGDGFATPGQGGAGGSSQFGIGGATKSVHGLGNPAPAANTGAGGGGGYNNGGGAQAGGAGSSGLVIVKY